MVNPQIEKVISQYRDKAQAWKLEGQGEAATLFSFPRR